jgi:hypothetical protein
MALTFATRSGVQEVHEFQACGINPPFHLNGEIMGLFNAPLTLKEESKPITKMIASLELLAKAHSGHGAASPLALGHAR